MINTTMPPFRLLGDHLIQIQMTMTITPPFRLHWVVCGTFHPLSSASDSLQDVKQVDAPDDDDDGGGDDDYFGGGSGNDKAVDKDDDGDW